MILKTVVFAKQDNDLPKVSTDVHMHLYVTMCACVDVWTVVIKGS